MNEKRKILRGSGADHFASGRAFSGSFSKRQYKTDCRKKSLILVDAILARGNAAQLKNVGNDFSVTELVLV